MSPGELVATAAELNLPGGRAGSELSDLQRAARAVWDSPPGRGRSQGRAAGVHGTSPARSLEVHFYPGRGEVQPPLERTKWGVEWGRGEQSCHSLNVRLSSPLEQIELLPAGATATLPVVSFHTWLCRTNLKPHS